MVETEEQKATRKVQLLRQARAPLHEKYPPYIVDSDTCLNDARQRLRKALEQTRQLRQAFTERVYGKYRVCLIPPESQTDVMKQIETNPQQLRDHMLRKIKTIKDEKDLEKKEASRLNAEVTTLAKKGRGDLYAASSHSFGAAAAASNASSGGAAKLPMTVSEANALLNADNGEQLMCLSAGLSLVILPEHDISGKHYVSKYTDRSPINPQTGQRVKGISIAAAAAGEVMLDRTRKAIALRAERLRRTTIYNEKIRQHQQQLRQHAAVAAASAAAAVAAATGRSGVATSALMTQSQQQQQQQQQQQLSAARSHQQSPQTQLHPQRQAVAMPPPQAHPSVMQTQATVHQMHQQLSAATQLRMSQTGVLKPRTDLIEPSDQDYSRLGILARVHNVAPPIPKPAPAPAPPPAPAPVVPVVPKSSSTTTSRTSTAVRIMGTSSASAKKSASASSQSTPSKLKPHPGSSAKVIRARLQSSMPTHSLLSLSHQSEELRSDGQFSAASHFLKQHGQVSTSSTKAQINARYRHPFPDSVGGKRRAGNPAAHRRDFAQIPPPTAPGARLHPANMGLPVLPTAADRRSSTSHDVIDREEVVTARAQTALQDVFRQFHAPVGCSRNDKALDDGNDEMPCRKKPRVAELSVMFGLTKFEDVMATDKKPTAAALSLREEDPIDNGLALCVLQSLGVLRHSNGSIDHVASDANYLNRINSKLFRECTDDAAMLDDDDDAEYGDCDVYSVSLKRKWDELASNQRMLSSMFAQSNHHNHDVDGDSSTKTAEKAPVESIRGGGEALAETNASAAENAIQKPSEPPDGSSSDKSSTTIENGTSDKTKSGSVGGNGSGGSAPVRRSESVTPIRPAHSSSQQQQKQKQRVPQQSRSPTQMRMPPPHPSDIAAQQRMMWDEHAQHHNRIMMAQRSGNPEGPSPYPIAPAGHASPLVPQHMGMPAPVSHMPGQPQSSAERFRHTTANNVPQLTHHLRHASSPMSRMPPRGHSAGSEMAEYIGSMHRLGQRQNGYDWSSINASAAAVAASNPSMALGMPPNRTAMVNYSVQERARVMHQNAAAAAAAAHRQPMPSQPPAAYLGANGAHSYGQPGPPHFAHMAGRTPAMLNSYPGMQQLQPMNGRAMPPLKAKESRKLVASKDPTAAGPELSSRSSVAAGAKTGHASGTAAAASSTNTRQISSSAPAPAAASKKKRKASDPPGETTAKRPVQEARTVPQGRAPAAPPKSSAAVAAPPASASVSVSVPAQSPTAAKKPKASSAVPIAPPATGPASAPSSGASKPTVKTASVKKLPAIAPKAVQPVPLPKKAPVASPSIAPQSSTGGVRSSALSSSVAAVSAASTAAAATGAAKVQSKVTKPPSQQVRAVQQPSLATGVKKQQHHPSQPRQQAPASARAVSPKAIPATVPRRQVAQPTNKGDLQFVIPPVPNTISMAGVNLILSGRVFEAFALDSAGRTANHSLHIVQYLTTLGAAVPIPKTLVANALKDRLQAPMPKSVFSQNVHAIPREVVVACILVWLWHHHEIAFQEAFTMNGRIDVDHKCKWLIGGAIDAAMHALVTETNGHVGKSPLAVLLVAHSGKTSHGGGKSAEQQKSLVRLEVAVTSTVSRALHSSLSIDGDVDSSIPAFQDLVSFLDESRRCALQSKAQERTLLANIVSRTTQMSLPFSHAFVSSTVRAGEAIGHGELFENVQSELVRVTTQVPYDVFTDELGIWEDPCRPREGFTSNLTGDDLLRRAHARAIMQRSLKRLQDKYNIKGGTSSQGPYSEPPASSLPSGDGSRDHGHGHGHGKSSRSHSRGSSRRSRSSLAEPPCPPGTGFSAASSWNLYESHHKSLPLDWKPEAIANSPYGGYEQSSRPRSLSLSQAAHGKANNKGGGKTGRGMSVASTESNEGGSSRFNGGMVPSTREISWVEVAGVFQDVALPKALQKEKERSAAMAAKRGNILAPYVRRIGAFQIPGIEDDAQFDPEHEDLSETAILGRHQVVLDGMKEKIAAAISEKNAADAKKKQSRKRK